MTWLLLSVVIWDCNPDKTDCAYRYVYMEAYESCRIQTFINHMGLMSEHLYCPPKGSSEKLTILPENIG